MLIDYLNKLILRWDWLLWGVCFVCVFVVWFCVWDGVDCDGEGWEDDWDWFWVCLGEGCEFVCWFCCCCCWMLEE